MKLDQLLVVLDRAGANLVKLEEVWRQAEPFVPSGPQRGSSPEYDDLRRAWHDLLVGLPPIYGWTITDELPDIDALGQDFIDYLDIDELPFSAYEAGEQPGRDFAEYRYRLNRARRRAALTALVGTGLPTLLEAVPRDSKQRLESEQVDAITAAITEIEWLMGDAAVRNGRWSDLHRHLRFSEGQDWHDIHEVDWPSVRVDIEAAAFTDTDPLPVPEFDLGEAAASALSGTATVALAWDHLDDAGFERLLYDLLRVFDEHENVQWLTHPNAPDRGRDLSLDRILRSEIGSVRAERVIVQAKHWLRRSVDVKAIADTVASVKLWEPPMVHGVIIATSGRFTSDAVAWSEQHNSSNGVPRLDLWPESQLETLLAHKPHLAAAHGLRPDPWPDEPPF